MIDYIRYAGTQGSCTIEEFNEVFFSCIIDNEEEVIDRARHYDLASAISYCRGIIEYYAFHFRKRVYDD